MWKVKVSSGSSEPELGKFRAEPSRAGALQFSSQNPADILGLNYEVQSNFPILGLHFDNNHFVDHFLNIFKTIGISGVEYYNLGT